ncbi:hypothetical protein D3C81_851110 [compost metagenome]
MWRQAIGQRGTQHLQIKAYTRLRYQIPHQLAGITTGRICRRIVQHQRMGYRLLDARQ